MSLYRGEKRIYIVKERTTQDIEKALGEASVDVQNSVDEKTCSQILKH